MMNASDLIVFICSRNTALCNFIADLREADFSYEYRAELLESTDNYLKAAQAVYDYQYGKKC